MLGMGGETLWGRRWEWGDPRKEGEARIKVTHMSTETTTELNVFIIYNCVVCIKIPYHMNKKRHAPTFLCWLCYQFLYTVMEDKNDFLFFPLFQKFSRFNLFSSFLLKFPKFFLKILKSSLGLTFLSPHCL